MLLYSFLSRYPTISDLPPTLDKRRLLQAKWQACLEGHTGTSSQPLMLSSLTESVMRGTCGVSAKYTINSQCRIKRTQ